ncbi:MAG: N-acetylmuramoyl-L-alanine amidase [Dysgonamonadaceae bacterium]|nr:N-acetylmuramoyl-L-alanine amidase [Dysgonamonadaceae bacterium]
MSFIRNCLVLVCLFVTFFTYAQERDKPRRGEGIHAFLRRHNRDNHQYYHKFVKLNKSKFGKKNALLSGVFYVLPPIAEDSNKPKVSEIPDKQDIPDVPEDLDTLDANVSELSGERDDIEQQPVINKNSKSGYQPLFGQKYAYYTILDNKLEGACFFLSSGHGGPDCGAIAKVDGHELHEDEYAYDITLRLARNLLQHGATVHIIIQDPKDGIRDGKYLNNGRKETCMGSPIPLNQVTRLQQRTNKINQLNRKAKEKYRRAVFIHLDSRSKKKQLDVFFYYQDKPENRKKSKHLSETMRETFKDRYAKVQPGRGFSGTISTRNLAVMRNAEPVSIFMELANMQNTFDQRRYILDDNRQALANWMTLGFIQDYRNSK